MNPRLAGLSGSLIREINSRKKPGDIDLGLGEPVMRPDPAPFTRVAEWIAANGCPYSPNAGFMELREAIGRYAAVDAKDVVVTHGSQEAVYLAIRAAIDSASDEVLLVEPAYPAYEKICQMEGIAHAVAPLDAASGFAPSAEAVLRAVTPKTRLVVLSSPTNPTGRVWSRAELEKLAAGLGDIWVLSDEVYRELYYGEPPVSLAALHPRTLVAGGLSKSHAVTGLRLGWILASGQMTALISRAHQLITTSASTFSQRVALEVLTSFDGVAQTRANYAERRDALLAALAEFGLEHVPPDGAFYCMLRIPGGRSSLETAFLLLERERVATVPGVAFGASAEGWLRVTWVAEPSDVREGLSRIARFFQSA
ncbi:MAG: pyridoxal phosphate-dependent aminotransferase [Armatimonadetes bacterium]|nr:pyridoxal phosphate-dependent aminotransferase [Armatimonadota bacterium]